MVELSWAGQQRLAVGSAWKHGPLNGQQGWKQEDPVWWRWDWWVSLNLALGGSGRMSNAVNKEKGRTGPCGHQKEGLVRATQSSEKGASQGNAVIKQKGQPGQHSHQREGLVWADQGSPSLVALQSKGYTAKNIAPPPPSVDACRKEAAADCKHRCLDS